MASGPGGDDGQGETRFGSPRPTLRATRDGSLPRTGESGGFIGQLGLAETGGTSPGLVGIALALLLALVTYPIAWLVRRMRQRT